MEDYKYISVNGESEILEGKYKFTFGEKIPKQAGWKKIYEDNIESKISEYKNQIPETLSSGSDMNINIINSEKKETKPKPLFVMDTLLAAMKNVASLFPESEEIRKHLGENGIGTNATRSSIIAKVMDPDKNQGEALIIEDSKGKIISSDKAKSMVAVMPKELISPIKRAILSKELKQVEKGLMSETEILDKYRILVQNNIEAIKKIFQEKGAIAATISEKEDLGPCPLCSKSMIEKKKVYHCSGAAFRKTEEGGITNDGCNYMIRKNSLDRFGKKNITKTEVIKFLKKKELVVTLVSKTGKNYTAPMIIDEKWGVSIDFNSNKK